MGGAILCKHNNVITILCTGDYSDLESKLPGLTRISNGKQIELVDISNINIADVLRDQSKIQDTFASVFDKTK